MTTLAGAKIRDHRLRQRPKLTLLEMATILGVNKPTLHGWEVEGKRPQDAALVNRLAREGIADHADWYRPALCPFCERRSDGPEAASCTHRDCPLQLGETG